MKQRSGVNLCHLRKNATVKYKKYGQQKRNSGKKLEVYQKVMQWMDFNSCLNLCIAISIKVVEAYRFHGFVYNKTKKDIVDICHDMQLLVKNDPAFFKALLNNEGFIKTFNINEIFQIATFCGFEEVVSILIKDQIDPSFGDNWAIRFASALGHSKVVELLLRDSRVDPTVSDDLPIIMASCNGHLDVVKILMNDSRVHPWAQDDSPIIMGAENGHFRVVKALLKSARVNPASQDNCAIRNASKNGFNDIVTLLLKDPRVDAAADDNYAIKWAYEEGHTQVVNTLAKHLGLDAKDPETW